MANRLNSTVEFLKSRSRIVKLEQCYVFESRKR